MVTWNRENGDPRCPGLNCQPPSLALAPPTATFHSHLSAGVGSVIRNADGKNAIPSESNHCHRCQGQEGENVHPAQPKKDTSSPSNSVRTWGSRCPYSSGAYLFAGADPVDAMSVKQATMKRCRIFITAKCKVYSTCGVDSSGV